MTPMSLRDASRSAMGTIWLIGVAMMVASPERSSTRATTLRPALAAAPRAAAERSKPTTS
jgi:hypothetical protein